jgi:hypothetical protein
MSRRLYALLPILLLVGCFRKVEKAPADLEQLQPWLWDNYALGTDSDYADALKKFDAFDTVKDVAPDHEYTGSLGSHLSKDSVSVAPLSLTVDPTGIPGIILISEMACTLDQVEPLVYGTNQDEIHKDFYSSYSRVYPSETDLADYKSRKTSTLTWQTTYKLKSDPIYTAHISGGLRRVADQGATVTPHGAFLIGKAWLKEPGVFDGDQGQYFKQDYQLEIYYERTPGHVVHQFVDWRDMKAKIGPSYFTTADSLYQSVVLSNDIEWDKAVASHCGK